MENNNKGIFINGREQAIELLQQLEPDHRNRLLENIRKRNSQVAAELQSQAISFDDLRQLNDYQLKIIFSNIDPKIAGMALQFSPQEFQKRVLEIIDRETAEHVFQVMVSEEYMSKELCLKARRRIMSAVSSIFH